MKFVIQRVKEANVKIDGSIKGQIGLGFVVLIGVCENDTKEIADKMIRKLTGLRIFDDENGKTNLSLESVRGSLLLISQFTLYANCKKGNRPSFVKAGNPQEAEKMYDYIVGECKKFVALANANNLEKNMKVETGEFGAEMEVSLINHGPFTIVLDSDEL